MRNRIIIVFLSILLIVFNIFLFYGAGYGFKYALSEPDRPPPFGLSQEQFSTIAIYTTALFLFISIILSIYIIFRGKHLKQIAIPSCFTLFICVAFILVLTNFTITSQSWIPRGDYYYWKQTREYKNETKYIRWKRPLNDENAEWELDSMSVY